MYDEIRCDDCGELICGTCGACANPSCRSAGCPELERSYSDSLNRAAYGHYEALCKANGFAPLAFDGWKTLLAKIEKTAPSD